MNYCTAAKRRLTWHPARVRIDELGDLARQLRSEALERLRLHRAQPGQLPLGQLARGGDAAFAQIAWRSHTLEDIPDLAITHAAHRRHRGGQRKAPSQRADLLDQSRCEHGTEADGAPALQFRP